MALKFNSYMFGPNGIIRTVAGKSGGSGTINASGSILGGTGTFFFYPSTVAYPSTAPFSNSLPSGIICNAATAASNFTINANGVLTLNVVSITTIAAISTATISWWAWTNSTSSSSPMFISDSIGTTGSGKVLTLSSLSAVSGSTLLITGFNLRFI